MENEKDIPKTAVFNVRADIRDVACIARSFDVLGQRYTTKSSLIRLGLSLLAKMLSETVKDVKDIDTTFTSTETAMKYVGLNPSLKMTIEKDDLGFIANMKQVVKENTMLEMSPNEAILKRAEELRANEEPEFIDNLDEDGIPEHLK